MAFSTDRDMLVLEPNLFRDVTFAGQRVTEGSDGILVNGVLRSAASDFELAGVDTGHVVVVENAAYEVVAQIDATTLAISRLRSRTDDAPIPPNDGTDLTFSITTFGPQIEIVHQQMMQLLEFETGLDEVALIDAVLNDEEVAQVESLGAMHMVMSGASSLIGDRGMLWMKATMYRERFVASRARLRVLLDIDGDDVADRVVWFNMIQLSRA